MRLFKIIIGIILIITGIGILSTFSLIIGIILISIGASMIRFKKEEDLEQMPALKSKNKKKSIKK